MNLLDTVNGLLVDILTHEDLAKGFSELITPDVYNSFKSIMQNVTKPVAYTILSLFLLLELQKAIRLSEGSGSNMAGVEMVLKILFQTVVFKYAIEKSDLIIEKIYDLSVALTTDMLGLVSSISTTDAVFEVEELTFGTVLFNGAINGVVMILILIITAGIWAYVSVFIKFRMLEIYVYMAIAPIPLATLPHQEFSQIGKNFLKNYAAVCLQGTLIYLVCYILPTLANSLQDDDGQPFSKFLRTVIFLIMTVYALMSTGKWSKIMTGAA
ncbi:MAG: hypothetical protein FWG30_03725 [Eubacteriaceae bacterium]|nr:hypothetical protein [Eubacteriaceae bacterium]